MRVMLGTHWMVACALALGACAMDDTPIDNTSDSTSTDKIPKDKTATVDNFTPSASTSAEASTDTPSDATIPKELSFENLPDVAGAHGTGKAHAQPMEQEDVIAGNVSAVSWFDGSTHIRVYTCEGNALTEQCWDGNGPWYTGALSAAGSTVGATSWVSGGQIHLRVYAASGNRIVEHCWDQDHWYTGAFSAAGESSSATSWLDSSGALHIRVYVRARNGSVTEQCWDGSGPWYPGAYHGTA